MKKLLVLAMMATLLMAGSAFAVNRHLTPVPNATFQFGAPGVASGPTTTNNDDSCDIGVAPAATLLLPYFEVDTTSARTTTTLFTITNVSRFSQIAHVTLWTDRSFPVLDFNIFLTGYDVQGINLFDVLTSGTVAQVAGTGPTTAQSPLGTAGSIPSLTATSTGGPGYTNPNFSPVIGCGSLPGVLPASVIAPVRTALITGAYTAGCTPVGNNHPNGNAIGYATVDVAANCSTRLPNDPAAAYFLNDILFDNVLIGDYQQLGPAPAGTVASSFDAGGAEMVHIRAVPEGGGAGSIPGTNLPFTFYDRYTAGQPGGLNRTVDRRQPLPSTWAARYIQGGTGAFATNYKIWREGFGTGACGTVAQNAVLPVAEIVRFDEHENPFVSTGGVICSPNCAAGPVTLPGTSSTNTADTTIYPVLGGGEVGGWMYLNLNDLPAGAASGYSVTRAGAPITTASNLGTPRASQNWVIVEMFGNVGTSRLTVDFNAAWLGNGCSPTIGTSIANGGQQVIGPVGGVFVCPPGFTTTNGSACTGTNTTPLP
jgi:hypothetical protein